MIKVLKYFAVAAGALLLALIIYLALPIPAEKTPGPVGGVDPSELVWRSVQKNKHQFTPGYGLGFSRRRSGWVMLFRPDSLTYYDPAILGVDGKDWSKLGGVNYFSPWKPSTWPNNRRSAMGVWRSGAEPFTFEVAGYTNLKDGGHRFTKHVTARAGDRVKIDYDIFKGLATFELWVNDSAYLSDAIIIDLERLQINIPPWHGGGKPAPKALTFQTVLKVK